MAEIGVLGQLFFLICHMDQNVKSATVVVALNDRQPLLFVKLQEFSNRDAEVLKENILFFTTGLFGEFAV